MDLIQCYSSTISSSSEDECLTEKEFRSVYLITYGQADLENFPTRQVARVVVQSFSTGTAQLFSGFVRVKSIAKAENIVIWLLN